MIAVDTNVLVHAHRVDSEWHPTADAALRVLATSRSAWSIPWPCVHEFLRIVTDPRIFERPTPVAVAISALRYWAEESSAQLIGESDDHLGRLERLCVDGQVSGARVHDARIASICLAHGVRELWSADRDFSRFPQLTTRNPLIPE